jgi:hypothetical protein
MQPTQPDHGARDRTVAVNSYTTVLGRAAVPEEAFRAYWRDVHGPVCSRVPGLGFYVQHHFARQRDAHAWPATGGVGPLPGYVLDGAVEIGWASTDDQATFQDASDVLFSDEQNVFEETAAYPLPEGSTTVVDRQPDPVPNGPDPYDRVHVHVAPAPGRADELARFLTTEFAPVAADSPDVVKLRIHLPGPHDNASPNPPAPNVGHTLPDDRVELAVLELAFTDPLARRRFLDGDAFAATHDRWAALASSVTPFPVTGVHVFVRDGGLTTAGLRGSRVAELISALAAANQVGDEVVHLMRTGRPLAAD